MRGKVLAQFDASIHESLRNEGNIGREVQRSKTSAGPPETAGGERTAKSFAMSGVTRQWEQTFEAKRIHLRHAKGFERYFHAGPVDMIEGAEMDVMPIGIVDLPTGQVLAGDPLVTIDEKSSPFFQRVPPGRYQVEAAVLQCELDTRYAAVRVKIKPSRGVFWENAVPSGASDLNEIDKRDADERFYAFGVDAGLACVMDLKARDPYCKWIRRFENVYDDYFAAKFEESYRLQPKYQRPLGDC